MAGADLLIDIVRAVANGNQELFRRALEALITEERFKQHHVLADLLLEIRPKRRQGDLPLPTDIRRPLRPQTQTLPPPASRQRRSRCTRAGGQRRDHPGVFS
jgi:hypothetical protein